MTESRFRSDIRAYVVENFLFGRGDELRDDDSFLESGLIDSTGVLGLVGYLETTFAIAVADEDLVPANLDSVVRVCQFVERKLQEQAARRAG